MCIVSLALAAMASALVGSAGARDAGEAQVPPMLVFERGGDLYRMTIDGSETVRLTATKVKESDPAPSPDGLRIAYVRGSDELWTMDTQGTDHRRVVAARSKRVRYASTGSPSWSPNGRFLYFERWSQRSNICASILRVGANGAGLKPITPTDGQYESYSDPAVAPDGRRIAVSYSYYCDPGWYGRLRIIGTTGKPKAAFSKAPRLAGIKIDPAWSPDGRQIVFVTWDFDESERQALYVVATDGSGLRRITTWTSRRAARHGPRRGVGRLPQGRRAVPHPTRRIGAPARRWHQGRR